MNSLRTQLLAAILAVLLLAALLFGWATYRSVLAETESLFDYQLRQLALSLRDQGEIAPDQVRAFADEQLDFVIQIWSEDGRSIYASRPRSRILWQGRHSSAPGTDHQRRLYPNPTRVDACPRAH